LNYACSFLLNPIKIKIYSEAHHRFVEEDLDWGFHNYISKNIFYNEEKGKRFVVDDTVTFIIAIKVFQDPTGVLWHNFVK